MSYRPWDIPEDATVEDLIRRTRDEMNLIGRGGYTMRPRWALDALARRALALDEAARKAIDELIEHDCIMSDASVDRARDILGKAVAGAGS